MLILQWDKHGQTWAPLQNRGQSLKTDPKHVVSFHRSHTRSPSSRSSDSPEAEGRLVTFKMDSDGFHLFLGKLLLTSIFLFTYNQRKGTEVKGERDGGRKQDKLYLSEAFSFLKCNQNFFLWCGKSIKSCLKNILNTNLLAVGIFNSSYYYIRALMIMSVLEDLITVVKLNRKTKENTSSNQTPTGILSNKPTFSKRILLNSHQMHVFLILLWCKTRAI